MNRTRNAIILVVVTIGLVGALFSASMTLAGASTGISFTFTTDPDVGIGGDPGTLFQVGEITVPDDLIGKDCVIVVDVHNNDSVRSGTDIVVSTALGSVTLPDAEAVKGNAPPQTLGNLVLGHTITVEVRFGPAGVASVDATIHAVCDEVPPPTVPTTTPPTTTVPPVPPVQPPTPVPPTPVTATPTVTG